MKNAFSLTEILITIAIMAVLATLALPRLIRNNEQVAAGEGVQIITALHSAILRFCADRPDMCKAGSWPASCNAATMDVGIPTLSNFNLPQCFPANGNVGIQRNTGAYTLYVESDGRYLCDPPANDICIVASRAFPTR